MRAVVWISEGAWQVAVDRARELLPTDAEVTLVHVAPSDAEELAAHPGPGRLGRHRPPPGPPVRQIAQEEAQALLTMAADRIGRPTQTLALRGQIEREVLTAAADADVLVVVREGDERPGPKSLGHRARFVVDHAPCQVLLVWAGAAPSVADVRWPPHRR